jgi:hypothetical protein
MCQGDRTLAHTAKVFELPEASEGVRGRFASAYGGFDSRHPDVPASKLCTAEIHAVNEFKLQTGLRIYITAPTPLSSSRLEMTVAGWNYPS